MKVGPCPFGGSLTPHLALVIWPALEKNTSWFWSFTISLLIMLPLFWSLTSSPIYGLAPAPWPWHRTLLLSPLSLSFIMNDNSVNCVDLWCSVNSHPHPAWSLGRHTRSARHHQLDVWFTQVLQIGTGTIGYYKLSTQVDITQVSRMFGALVVALLETIV